VYTRRPNDDREYSGPDGKAFTLPMPRSSHPDQEARRDTEQEVEARRAAATAALHRLDEIVEAGVARTEVVDQLRQRAENRQTAAQEELDEGEPEASAGETYRQLAREMIAAEREQFVRLRADGRLSNEAFRRVQRELDLEESALLRG